MRIALAQINPVVGDLLGNATRILQSLDSLIETTGRQPDLLVTPELSLWGYPPRDLLFFANLSVIIWQRPDTSFFEN